MLKTATPRRGPVRFFFWRLAIVQWLIHYGWSLRRAWEYSGAMRNDYFNEGFQPREALDADMEYWGE